MKYRDFIRKLTYIRDEILDLNLYLEEREQELAEDDKEETEEFEKVGMALCDMQQILDILRCYTW